VLAKRFDSHSLPGRRTEAWVKMKPVRRMHCAILGYVPDGEHDFKSLIIASDTGDGLRCVGRAGSGLTDALKRRLLPELKSRVVDEPLVPCGETRGEPGRWVEPGLYCVVSFVEITARDNLRAPAFVELLTA
jgi:bifunctional non-homologous end joining protein LigD